MSSLHSDDFNFVYKNDLLYVGGSTTDAGNGAYNKNIVNAYLPSSFNGVRIYGTQDSCFQSITTLKYVFIPRTYKVIEDDFCVFSSNVVSIVFEENSEVESIGGWFAEGTSITQLILPSSIKTLSTNSPFANCKKLKLVIFKGNIFLDAGTSFSNSPDNIVILVKHDYKYDTFGGKSVMKIIPEPKQLKTCMKRQKTSNKIFFVVVINIYS